MNQLHMLKSKKTKLGIVVCFSLIIFLIFVLLNFLNKNKKMDIEKLSAEELMKNMIEKDFLKNIPPSDLEKLYEKLENLDKEKEENFLKNLSENELETYLENFDIIEEKVIDIKSEEFFSLSPEKREEFLEKETEKLIANPDRLERWDEKLNLFEEDISEYREYPGKPFQRRYRRGFSRRNPDAVLQRARQRLSLTTPQQRAKRDEFLKKLRERRKRRKR